MATHTVLLSARDAARALGLAEGTLAKLRLTGKGPLFVKLGRRVAYRPEDLDRWIAANLRRSPLLHALVRAFHWQSLLDDGHYGSVNELGKAHGKNASYVAAVLRLTLLAPDVIEATLDGRQPVALQLQQLIRNGMPVAWAEQQSALGVRC